MCIRDRYDPVPITSTGTLANEKTLHFSGPNPLDAIILTFSKPALSNISRKCQIAAAETPVPIKYFSSC